MTSTAQAASPKDHAPHPSRAKLTASRHNITGQVTLMPNEDREAFQTFCAALVKDLAPQGALETQLAQSIADDNWRLNRGRAIESNILALGFTKTQGPTGHPGTDALIIAETWAADPKQFHLLSLYLTRTNRDIQRNLTLLRQLQTERRAQHLKDVAEAAALHQAAKAANRPFNPAQNGFVCSTPEIELYLTRQRHLHQAAKHQNRKFDKARAA
jgi:hypothetical protein